MAQRTHDGTLKFSTEIAQASQDKVGKHPIIAKTISTTDIPTSTVINDHEAVNDKAITYRRGTEPQAPVTPEPDPEPLDPSLTPVPKE